VTAHLAENRALADEALVSSTLEGDRDAFEVLIQRHQKPIAHFLFRMVGDPESALDLAQEVFTRVYFSLRSFDPRYRFTTWVYRIASNAAIDHLRRRRILPVSLDRPSSRDDGTAPAIEPVDRGPAPDDVIATRELARRIEGEIERLPAPYRELIRLRHRNHLTYHQIARATQLPLGTVKNRMFRARETLRRAVESDR
jgi:RNA polymerase sigma-70 factor (ECF subfamily)